MWQTSHCGDSDPHEAHDYTAEADVICTGMARCGVAAHERHWMVEAQDYRCPGVCDCGDRMRGLHGPGEHK